MFYKVEYQKRAHQEVEKIFRVLLPEQGLAVREEQIRLCHEMLDTLLGERIALCDAGVGIGKTYAYLVACVLMRKYSILMERNSLPKQHPGGSIHFQHCLAKSDLVRICSVFIKSFGRTGHYSDTTSGSGTERKRTFCL